MFGADPRVTWRGLVETKAGDKGVSLETGSASVEFLGQTFDGGVQRAHAKGCANGGV